MYHFGPAASAGTFLEIHILRVLDPNLYFNKCSVDWYEHQIWKVLINTVIIFAVKVNAIF